MNSKGGARPKPIGCIGRTPLPEKKGSRLRSEQPGDPPLAVDRNVVGGGDLGEAGHGHDVAADRDHELGAGGEPHLADGYHVVGGCALERGVGGEAVLGLGDVDRQVAEPPRSYARSSQGFT